MIKNIPPKGVSFSDLICTFTRLSLDFLIFFCNTKISKFFDMAKPWAARLCRLPKQDFFVAQDIIKVKIYSVAEFVKQDMQMKTKANEMKCK